MSKTVLCLLLAMTAVSVTKGNTQSLRPAQAMQTLRLGGSMQVGQAATESLSLAAPVYIKNLVIQAQGYRTASTIEVMVNGQVKGTIYAPGSDPSYVVTIAEVARSIEFRHRDGGTMQITSVVGTVSEPIASSFSVYHGNFNGRREDVVRLASIVLKDLEILAGYASPSDDQTYLFPIKRNAGLVYVMATAHGTLSKKTIDQLVALCDQIAFAQPYLDKMMMLDSAFTTVVALMTVREALRGLLN